MGAGNAKAIKEYFQRCSGNLPKFLAQYITDGSTFGMKCFKYRFHLIGAFQTKTSWKRNSTLELIEYSVSKLNEYANKHTDLTFHLPFPGCSNGGLRHEDVLPLLTVLPDNVIIYRG